MAYPDLERRERAVHLLPLGLDRPELVNTGRMRELEAKMIDVPAAIRSGQTSFVAMGMDQAYAGAPAEATADEGEQTFAVLTDMLVELMREVAA